jgi:hypothetical protein
MIITIHLFQSYVNVFPNYKEEIREIKIKFQPLKSKC